MRNLKFKAFMFASALALSLNSNQAYSSEHKSMEKQFEALRLNIPPAKTISEQNGVSIQDLHGQYFTCTRLAAAAASLKLDSKKAAEVAVKYMEDPDFKIRFIAANALNITFNVYPNGMSISDIQECDSARHKQLVELFQQAITKKFGHK